MIPRNALVLSAQRALLFGASRSLRFLSVEVADGGLKMRVYLDSPPSEAVRDLYSAVCGEIDGDFPELDLAKGAVEIRHDERPYAELPHLEHLVFARSDAE